MSAPSSLAYRIFLIINRSTTEKTIEGDLFAAFVAAGAISKANADNPAKSSLVRCARTDKGVHAAGNVISLKLVIEDSDIVQKINEKLCPQIRVWGIERTNGGFSAYQVCESRIYEYLIPTYCFLPPHPRSFLGQKIVELAEEAGDLAGYEARQADALGFWSAVEESSIKPLFEGRDRTLSEKVLDIFYEGGDSLARQDPEVLTQLREFAAGFNIEKPAGNTSKSGHEAEEDPSKHEEEGQSQEQTETDHSHEATPLDLLLRHLRHLQIKAKKDYRIHPDRLSIVRSSLSRYVGSHRFHNHTIEKTAKDPSSVRVIKSFVVDGDPIIINGTEWLSLKVHGQSFMMHQIRKMVSLVALVVRCGCHEGRIQDTYLPQRLSIPKAPGLGLLLERPIFDSYNKKLEEFGRASIDFSRYEKEIQEFKQREIYERIFQTEEAENPFNIFFSALDQTRSSQLLYLTSVGPEAVKRTIEGDPNMKARYRGTADAIVEGADQDGNRTGSGSQNVGNIDDVFADDDEEAHNEGS